MKNQFDNFTDYKISKIIEYVLNKINSWGFYDKAGHAWFRGQNCDNPPIPGIFREDYDEFNLNTTFRNRVAALKEVPETDRIDKWLFLMQHYFVPTRLLDWTESLLNALFFALDGFNDICDCKKEKQNPTLWIIHPYKLNEYSNMDYFPNTWSRYDEEKEKKVINTNSGVEHFRLAFHKKNQWAEVINLPIVEKPIAIHVNYLDFRLFSQQSCFTIHGTDDRDFVSIFKNTELIKNEYLLKFIIPREYAHSLLIELNKLGINKSNIFPDIEHFALDLKRRFLQK